VIWEWEGGVYIRIGFGLGSLRGLYVVSVWDLGGCITGNGGVWEGITRYSAGALIYLL
jgi:hypothetical protein